MESPASRRDRRGKRVERGQRGFTYLSMLFLVAMMGAGLAAIGEVWSQSRQRDREQELLWIGSQFRSAIALYYLRTPGAVKRYPEQLADLLEDRRYVTTQRYLRRIYTDPMTGDARWGTVRAPDGGIMGVYSLSGKAPLKRAGFGAAEASFSDGSRYQDWQFVFVPPNPASPVPTRTPTVAARN